jgi:hypothetical protein
MAKHQFLFESGIWLGEGTVSFSGSAENIHFYTRWEIEQLQTEGLPLRCKQTVELQGIDDKVVNALEVTTINTSSFEIWIENDLMVRVGGKGVIDSKKVAWEFRGQDHFEGFEVYELLDNGDYKMHAEYASSDQFRTIINGMIWKKEE